MIPERVRLPDFNQPIKTDGKLVQCAQGPYYHRALNVSIILSVFDVTSDFLSMAFREA